MEAQQISMPIGMIGMYTERTARVVSNGSKDLLRTASFVLHPGQEILLILSMPWGSTGNWGIFFYLCSLLLLLLFLSLCVRACMCVST